MSTEATLRLEATSEQLKRELDAVKENMHCSLVEIENDNENGNIENYVTIFIYRNR